LSFFIGTSERAPGSKDAGEADPRHSIPLSPNSQKILIDPMNPVKKLYDPAPRALWNVYPVECLPREIHFSDSAAYFNGAFVFLFNWGEAYFTGVAPEDGTWGR